MQRQRDGLVPIGEALADLDGPVQAIREASPQALHHFTQADQVNQLVGASEADPALGFMARTMALCSLPRTNPGNRLQYKRVNGPYKLIHDRPPADHKLPLRQPAAPVDGVALDRSGTDPKPRDWCLAETRLRSSCGRSAYTTAAATPKPAFAIRCGGSFGCTVSTDLRGRECGAASASNALIADRTEFWWNERKPDEPSHFGRVRFAWANRFLQRDHQPSGAARHEHPDGAQTLHVGTRSLPVVGVPHLRAPRSATPLLAGRCTVSSEAHPDKASDKQHSSNVSPRRVLRELKKIKLAWTELNYSTAPGVLILHPSTPAIAPVESIPTQVKLISRFGPSQRAVSGLCRVGLDSRYPPPRS